MVSDISRPLAGIIVVGLVFAAGFVLVYVVTVRTVRGRLFGDASLRGALLTRAAAAGADTILNAVSVASLLGAVAMVATVALIRLERVRGLAAIGLLAGANLSALLLKGYLLDRPDLGLREVSPATLNSLPSGHATAVLSAFAALLFVTATTWRYPTALVGLLAATLTALATMSAGWHRAGDSMAAFLLVGVWTVIAAVPVVVAEASRSGTRPGFEWPPSARWLAVASAGLFTLGIAMGAALDAAGPIRGATLGSWVAFIVGGLLITGTGIVVVLGMLEVLAVVDAASSPERRRSPGSPHDTA